MPPSDLHSRPPRLAILPDYPQEHWPSMDLMAEMLSREADQHFSDLIRAELIRPPYKQRATLLLPRSAAARNADRLMNRLMTYPRFVRRQVRQHFDCFH